MKDIFVNKYSQIADNLSQHKTVKWWVHGKTRRISQPPYKTPDEYDQDGILAQIRSHFPADIQQSVQIIESGVDNFLDQHERGYFVFSIKEEEQKVEVKAPEIKEEAPKVMTLSLETSYKLHVDSNRGKHWIVIGCGGNGGYYIPQMLRQIALQNKRLELSNLRQHKVTLIDADDIEDKNLTRQNFVRNDVGKNKAEVMASRYGRAFGIEVDYIPEYVESSQQLINIAQQGGLKPVFVGAVDNNKTRTLIDGAFKHFRGSFWIDAGNEEWGGQVVCGYSYNNISPVKDNKKPHSFHLPSVLEIYPEIAEAQDKLPTELSCAERAVSAPQNIFTNMTAANLMMGFTNTILTANPNENEGLKQHAVAFNSQSMSFTTKLNTMANLTPAQEEVRV